MRTSSWFLIAFLLVGVLIVPAGFAQDYTRFSLPEGALARLGKGRVGAVAYSPDGTRLAVAGRVGIWLYDAYTGAEVALLTGHPDSDRPEWSALVPPMSFSPDGLTLASGYNDKVMLWDVAGGQERATVQGHGSWVTAVSFSADGLTLASGSADGTVLLWDVEGGEERATVQGHTDAVQSVSFSPDGRTLASRRPPSKATPVKSSPWPLPPTGAPWPLEVGTIG